MSSVGFITAASPQSIGLATQPPSAPPQQPERTRADSVFPPTEPAVRTDGGLSEEAKQEIAQLKARDREVRTHEQAHKSVGGPYAGSISYEFVTGPDQRQYAVGGEVPIDAAPIEGDPEATIRKMEIVYAAALAPAEPSPQDRSVARLAQSQITAAQVELSQLRQEERAALLEGNDEAGSPSNFVESFGRPEQENPYAIFDRALQETQELGQLLERTI